MSLRVKKCFGRSRSKVLIINNNCFVVENFFCIQIFSFYIWLFIEVSRDGPEAQSMGSARRWGSQPGNPDDKHNGQRAVSGIV